MTNTWDKFVANFSESRNGSYYLNYYWISTGNLQAPTSLLIENNPDAKVVAGEAVSGPYGDKNAYGYSADLGWALVFKNTLTDEQVARAMQVVDYLQTDEDALFALGGVEGETFEFDEFRAIKSLITTEEQITNGINVFPIMQSPDTIKYSLGNDSPNYQFFVHGSEQPLLRSVISNTPLAKSTEAGIGMDLGTMMPKFIFDSISGVVNINDDKVWDDYVQSLYAAGLTEQTAEAAEIYEAQYK